MFVRRAEYEIASTQAEVVTGGAGFLESAGGEDKYGDRNGDRDGGGDGDGDGIGIREGGVGAREGGYGG